MHYYRRFAQIYAVQLPEKDGDRTHVDDFLVKLYGPDHPITFEEDGRIEVYEGEFAKPGDWLVSNGIGEFPMIYEDALFAASFVTAAEYAPEYKAEMTPPANFPFPPLVFAAVAALAEKEGWSAKDHQMFLAYLATVHENQIPPGWTCLRSVDLNKLDPLIYESLRQVFPSLPERTSLITLDTSIGGALRAH